MTRRLLWIALTALLVAALTALIFLIRAGDTGATGWPTTFDLSSSDNGVLFQFAQDVFTGRALDWSFSPQVFVFPEIPISLVAYALAGGTVQAYYLIVAAMNNALLFVGLFALIRYLFPGESLARRLVRAGIATFPLLMLPLIGATWLFEYQLAPTYYFGMYLMIIVAPILFFGCARWVKIALGIGIALTAASNPLALVFTVPALACVLLLRGFSGGFRTVLRPAAWSGGTILLAFVIRIAFFTRLQGGSPLAYIDDAVFSGRIANIETYIRSLLAAPATASVVLIGAVLAVGGLAVAIVLAVRLLRKRETFGPRTTATLYYSLVPVTGLAATLVLIITDYLYLWPVLIAPLVFVLLPLPTRWVPWALPVLSAALVATAFVSGAVPDLAAASAYFSYRSPETRCLDEKLPPDVTIGYSTFSDARRIELTSRRPFRLIQLKSSGVRAYWLTNRDYARDNVGRFFYINAQGDEPPINVGYLEHEFGKPDSSFTCGPGQTVLIYSQSSKLAAIKARYSTLPAP
ncbi:MAG: hypothetical protein JWQ47_868 [Glaciihabitans sp.]|nr:hypothetical protein [Glaciihabitans sp.]